MRILIACEFSGIVRDAFAARGHDAWSCDLLPSERPGNHLRGNVLRFLNRGWDAMIAHPPCPLLANSGVRWLFEDVTRWPKLFAAADFFRALWECGIPKIALENPIMHKYGKRLIGISQTQVIQPWQFGHGETKATCLWLKNFPRLVPTKIVSGREARVLNTPPPERTGGKTAVGLIRGLLKQWLTNGEQPIDLHDFTQTLIPTLYASNQLHRRE